MILTASTSVLLNAIIRQHYKSYSDFRRPGTAENKLFSAASGLFSVVPGRQKKLAENKAIFSAARVQPPKITYFWRLSSWPPKI
jgi:hypothetical protein